MTTRSVSLLVGNRTYSLVTSLDDDRLDEVSSLLHEVVSATDPRMLQDERLFLASLHLASTLVSVFERLDDIAEEP